MFLNRLELVQFKNHQQRVLTFDTSINFIIGNNGIGKTNILDAIYYLAVFRSHIHHIDSQNILQGESFFRLVGSFEPDYDVVVKYALRQKIIEIKQVKINKYSEYFGHIPLVLSCPADIFLLHDGSEERRKLLDYTISIFDKEYLQKLLHYQQILEQRNAHLKNTEPVDKGLIEYYDGELVRNGTYIFEQRKHCVLFLTQAIEKWYSKIALQNEPIQISYSSQLLENDFGILLKNRLEKDILLKRSTVGVHRDDIEIEMLGIDIKRIASQGQQKSLLYALRFAQAEFIYHKTHQKLIFLLDDFSDKLDIHRQTQLLNTIYDIDFVDQWFLTDTNAPSFEKNDKLSVYSI